MVLIVNILELKYLLWNYGYVVEVKVVEYGLKIRAVPTDHI